MKIVIAIEQSLTDELAPALQAHWLFCTSSTPIEHVYALDASKLFTPDITVFGARIDGELVGVGAMRKLDSEHAELKSMGYKSCDAFGEYVLSEDNTCMTKFI